MIQRLQEECKKKNQRFDEDDLQYFFGLYQSSPGKFKFLPGKSILIKDIAKEVKKVVDQDGNLEAFTAAAYFKVSRKDTCQLFGCTFFGKKSRTQKRIRMKLEILGNAEFDNTDDKPISNGGIKGEFIPKLKAQFEWIDPSLNGQDYLSEEMVSIKNNGSSIKAYVECIFCIKEKKPKKTFMIQFDAAKNGLAYWNFSNFRSHLRKHTIATDEPSIDDPPNDVKISHPETIDECVKSESELNEFDELNDDRIESDHEQEPIDDDNADCDDVDVDIDDDSLIVVSDESALNASGASAEDIEAYEFEQIVDADSIEYKIFEQISQQNLFMTKAINTNNEKQYAMEFNLNDESTELRVIKIKGDGNCMFSCLAHQMFGHKVNSSEHEDATNSLREAAVKFIRENFKDFMFELKGRVLEERDIQKTRKGQRKMVEWKDITEKDCENYVMTLSNSKTYGGAESIKALSRIHRVNIVVFYELGPHYYPLSFDRNFDRTLFMAYRLANRSNNQWNHYDSVAEVDLKILCDCVNVLNAAALNKDNLASTKMEVTLE